MNNIICQFQLIIAQKINKLIYTVLNFRPLKGLISEECMCAAISRRRWESSA